MKIFGALNIFILSAIIMVAAAKNCAAMEPVQISDYDVGEFVHEYNKVASNTNFRYDISIGGNLKADPLMSDETYDVYIAFCGPKNHDMTLIIYANMAGVVSKIDLIFNYKDRLAAQCAEEIYPILFQTLGFSPQGLLNIEQEMQENPEAEAYKFWCEKADRYIFFKRNYAPNGIEKFLQVLLYAEA